MGGTGDSASFREPAPTPTRLERTTEPTPPTECTATCARTDMGNVQCCASGRFHEGKPPKKPKIKKKKLKGVSKKTNGVSGGKGNGGVQTVVTTAEDGSERAAPVAAQTQAPPEEAVEPPQQNEPEATSLHSEDSASRGETMAAARERFFSQVRDRFSTREETNLLIAAALY